MAVVEDVLATRLDLLGLSGYVSGIGQAGNAVGLFGTKLSGAQAAMLSTGIAAGAVGAGGFAVLIKATIDAADEQAKFQRASGNFKGSFPVGELQAFAGQMQNLTGVADEQVADFLGLLGVYKLTGEQAKELAPGILNTAEAMKAQGISTDQLAFRIGKALETGVGGRLMQILPFDQVAFHAADAAGKVEILKKALAEKGGNAAVEFAKSLPGQIQAMNSALDNARKALGGPLAGPITFAAHQVKNLADSFSALPQPVKDTATVIGVGLFGAMVLYSGATVFAISVTARLAAEQLKAAKAAKAMGDANVEAGAKTAGGSGVGAAAGGLGIGAGLKGGAPYAAIAALAAGTAFIPDDIPGLPKGRGSFIRDVLYGVEAGGALGLRVGGLKGAGIGAITGGFAGGVYGATHPGGGKSEMQQILSAIADNTAKIADHTDPSKLPIDTSKVPGARQVGALNFARFLA